MNGHSKVFRYRGVAVRKRYNPGGSTSYRVECPISWFNRTTFRQFKTKEGANVIQTSPMLKNLSVKAEDLQEAIKWMLDNKYCREIEVVNTHSPQGGRKPATNYEVNPTLL